MKHKHVYYVLAYKSFISALAVEKKRRVGQIFFQAIFAIFVQPQFPEHAKNKLNTTFLLTILLPTELDNRNPRM